jgi:DNA-binding CsgD family transcriptional regulator
MQNSLMVNQQGPAPVPDLVPDLVEPLAATGTDFAAGGLYDGGTQMVLTSLAGERSNSLRHLEVVPGRGVGGKALALGRPVWVADYACAKGISHHYDGPVRQEGLRAMIATPFHLPDGSRGVLYCALRRPMAMGDRVLDQAVTVIHQLERRAAIDAEVEGRIAELLSVRYEPARRDQCLRDIHAELALLRKDVEPGVADRIDGLIGRIGAAMGTPELPSDSGVRLTRRELDVLVQVASGATNLEVAERLGLSLATSKGYLKTATRKLGAQNRTEAVANARRAGLLP